VRDVTRTAVAVERFGKHVFTEKNSRNNRRTVFYAVRVEGLKKGQRRSFKSVEFRDASLQGYALGSRGSEATDLLSAVQWS
jgi:hypothetical protein